jgi:hypothetical protein
MFAVFLWAGNSTAFCKIHEQGEHYVVLKSWQKPIVLGVMINGTNWVSCMYLELISFSLSFCPVLWVMRTKMLFTRASLSPNHNSHLFFWCMFKYSSPTFHECNDCFWHIVREKIMRLTWFQVTNFLPNLRAQDGGSRNSNFIFPSF